MNSAFRGRTCAGSGACRVPGVSFAGSPMGVRIRRQFSLASSLTGEPCRLRRGGRTDRTAGVSNATTTPPSVAIHHRPTLFTVSCLLFRALTSPAAAAADCDTPRPAGLVTVDALIAAIDHASAERGSANVYSTIAVVSEERVTNRTGSLTATQRAHGPNHTEKGHVMNGPRRLEEVGAPKFLNPGTPPESASAVCPICLRDCSCRRDHSCTLKNR